MRWGGAGVLLQSATDGPLALIRTPRGSNYSFRLCQEANSFLQKPVVLWQNLEESIVPHPAPDTTIPCNPCKWRKNQPEHKETCLINIEIELRPDDAAAATIAAKKD